MHITCCTPHILCWSFAFKDMKIIKTPQSNHLFTAFCWKVETSLIGLLFFVRTPPLMSTLFLITSNIIQITPRKIYQVKVNYNYLILIHTQQKITIIIKVLNLKIVEIPLIYNKKKISDIIRQLT